MQESIHKNATPFAKRSRPASSNLSRKNHDRIYHLSRMARYARNLYQQNSHIVQLCQFVSLSVCAVIQSVNRIIVWKKGIYTCNTCNAVFRRFPPFSAVFSHFTRKCQIHAILSVKVTVLRKNCFFHKKIKIRNRRKEWNKDKIRVF